VKEEVWSKGYHVNGEDPNYVRKDSDGHIITRDTVAIDHFIPLAKGGTNDLSNLVPLHREANREKSDHIPGLPKKWGW
jgi:5-methylcytosine-specific restriction endonuclease McrA